MRALVRILASLPLLAVLDSGARGQAPESEITKLTGGRCQFVSIDKETNEDQVKKCPGPGGFRAVTRSSHTTAYLGFQSSKAREPQEVMYGWSLGDKVDWRGTRENGKFRPFAAIVRVIVKDPDTLIDGGLVLAVTRHAADKACVAALVDVAANPQANELAREAANSVARTFNCGKDKTLEKGASTKWTQSLIEQLRDRNKSE